MRDAKTKSTEDEPNVRTFGFSRLSKRLSARRLLYRSNINTSHRLLRTRFQSHGKHRPRVHWIRYAIFSAMLILLCALVFDLPVGAYEGHWPRDVVRVAAMLTDAGKAGWILYPTGLAILAAYGLDWRLWRRRRRALAARGFAIFAYLFFSLAAGGLIATLLKRVIGRARPLHFDALGPFSFHPFSNATFASFPSGHATTIGGLFAALTLLFPRFRVLFAMLALWIAFTRVLVDSHYPSDVIAGLSWGAWFSYFSALIFTRFGILFVDDGTGWPARRNPGGRGASGPN